MIYMLLWFANLLSNSLFPPFHYYHLIDMYLLSGFYMIKIRSLACSPLLIREI
jgi:hypothetical protein